MRTALRAVLTGAVATATVLVGGPAQATPPGPGVTGRTI
ncbi:cupin domain-containing protein, partial [Streptomyces sp. NPDC006356]